MFDRQWTFEEVDNLTEEEEAQIIELAMNSGMFPAWMVDDGELTAFDVLDELGIV